MLILPAATSPRAREKAISKAIETISLSAAIGDRHYAKMAGLVLTPKAIFAAARSKNVRIH
ncbi:MAG: hypothetical protein IPP63_04165 [Chloracidobacterium sp.]|nr:hypothetical protein [Chloracidobacterium sp.]